MLRNYLKTALRNLRKHAGYTLINLVGLAAGLACCLLIVLFVLDELSYDRFHDQADRIYRIYFSSSRASGTEMQAPLTPAAMTAALVEEFPEVEAATRILGFRGQRTVRYEDRSFVEEGIYYVDSTFFDVFSFPVRRGRPQAAFAAPNRVALTEQAARKYFGDEDPINKTLVFSDTAFYQVVGIVADAPPNSHFQFDFLVSMPSLWSHPAFRDDDWISDNFYAYLLLRQGADPAALEAKLLDLVARRAGAQMQEFLGYSFDDFLAQSRLTYFLQPLLDIHLRSHLQYELWPNGDVAYVYLFTAIAVFILLIACINFMNLATARSAGRALEVGVRKALGAQRAQLVRQFLSESMLLAFGAMLLAVVLAAALLPVFNALAHKALTVAVLFRPSVLLAMLGLVLGVGLLAGGYPAFFLSRFQPVTALKGAAQTGLQRSWLRNGLVIFQFAISIGLIVGTAVVFNQLHYARTKHLGFDCEHVVVIRRVHELGAAVEPFKQALLDDPRVVRAARAHATPGGTFGYQSFLPEGWDDNKTAHMTPLFTDHDLVETLRLEVVDGRDFSRSLSTDSSAFLINEAAVRMLGWETPVGKRLTMPGATGQEDTRTGEVIGVVADFHYASLHDEIAPMALLIYPRPLPALAVRLQPDDLPRTLAFLEATWRRFQPGKPFQYTFLDDDFDALYRADERLAQIFTAFALFAVLIACLGLFGLASFTAAQRRKEIGVRKVMGATVSQIVLLLSKDFTKLVLAAFVLAAPPAYFAMRRWLDAFAYRVDLSWLIFLLAGLLALLVALLTVSYQSVKAALADPVESLRYE